jgi:hypothetical protein
MQLTQHSGRTNPDLFGKVMHKFSDILLTRTLGHVLYLQTNNGISVLFSRSDAEDFEYRTGPASLLPF